MSVLRRSLLNNEGQRGRFCGAGGSWIRLVRRESYVPNTSAPHLFSVELRDFRAKKRIDVTPCCSPGRVYGLWDSAQYFVAEPCVLLCDPFMGEDGARSGQPGLQCSFSETVLWEALDVTYVPTQGESGVGLSVVKDACESPQWSAWSRLAKKLSRQRTLS